MPYRCQKCMSTFKTLSLYNRHATGPESNCKVAEIVRAKPAENKPEENSSSRPPGGQQQSGSSSSPGIGQQGKPQGSGGAIAQSVSKPQTLGGQLITKSQVTGGQQANRSGGQQQVLGGGQQSNRTQMGNGGQQVNKPGGGQQVIRPGGYGGNQQIRSQSAGTSQPSGRVQQTVVKTSVITQQSPGVRVGGQQGVRVAQSPAQVVRTGGGQSPAQVVRSGGVVRPRQTNDVEDPKKKIRAEITIDDNGKENVKVGGGLQRTGSVSSYSNRIIETYKCDQCPAKFDVKTRLEQHKEVHEEESRRCTVCEDDFAWPDSDHECYYTKYKLRLIAGDIVPDF